MPGKINQSEKILPVIVKATGIRLLLWIILTLLFEFVFGHYAAGKAWKEIN